MQQKISEIKERFQAASTDGLPELIRQYEADERSGVQAVIKSAAKKSRRWKKRSSVLFIC